MSVEGNRPRKPPNASSSSPLGVGVTVGVACMKRGLMLGEINGDGAVVLEGGCCAILWIIIALLVALANGGGTGGRRGVDMVAAIFLFLCDPLLLAAVV